MHVCQVNSCTGDDREVSKKAKCVFEIFGIFVLFFVCAGDRWACVW